MTAMQAVPTEKGKRSAAAPTPSENTTDRGLDGIPNLTTSADEQSTSNPTTMGTHNESSGEPSGTTNALEPSPKQGVSFDHV
jgi:hypothetical protein